MFWITDAYAMGAGQQAGQESFLGNPLISIVLIFGVFYFLLIRPQQKKAKEHRQMLESLKKGDAVITAGGLYGRIVEVKGDVILVDLGDTRVTVGRGFISGVPAKDTQSAAPKPEKKDKRKGKAKDEKEAAAVAAAPETPAQAVEAEVVAESAPVAQEADADKAKSEKKDSSGYDA